MDIPNKLKDLLINKKLCTLATSSDNEPYLSLMNFTYLEKENRIILSSRIDSKKYSNIKENKNISLLIFSASDNISATLIGTAETIEGDEGEEYREMHLDKSDSPQFILGDDKGLIIFSIEEIVIADNQDQVKYIC